MTLCCSSLPAQVAVDVCEVPTLERLPEPDKTSLSKTDCTAHFCCVTLRTLLPEVDVAFVRATAAGSSSKSYTTTAAKIALSCHEFTLTVVHQLQRAV